MRGEILDGRYRLREPIGSGGMGRVWRAEDERIGREVAVKVLSHVDEDTSATRFAREARVVGGLSSPHIVTLHDFGEAQVSGERVLYLVMEHLQGRDLGAVLESRRPDPVPVPEVMAWATEICAGLETAHRAGIVHRDIKPANILLTTAGTIKILDFGIARLLASAASATRTDLTGVGFVIGTPLYMSPEQIRAPDVLDSRSDLYSLGCLLHTLLTGRPPFTGAGTAVLAQHLGDIPEPPSARRPELLGFGELDALIMRLLAKEPGERPKDAAEVAALLRTASEAGAAGAASGSVPAPAPGASGDRDPADPAVPAVMGTVPYTKVPVAPATVPTPPAPPPPAPPPMVLQPTAQAYRPPGPPPTATPERLRIAERASRGGAGSTRSVAATWLSGAGTALVTCVLLVICTPTEIRGVLAISAGAFLAGMASAQVFTDIFTPQGNPLGKRISSTVALTLPLGAIGTAIDQALTNDGSLILFAVAFGASVAALTAGVLIADRLIAVFRVPARAALLISLSGWTNGLVTWGILVYATSLEGLGSLPIGCVVWLVTALALGWILAPSGSRPRLSTGRAGRTG